jgi:hypothetical protein
MQDFLGLGAVAPVLTIRSESEISEAIRACAMRCLASVEDVREYIHSFGEKLRGKGWDDTDVKQFQIGTLYVLSYLKKDDSLLPQNA